MTLSKRLRDLVDALPLTAGMRVIEVGCGPGAAAREVAERLGPNGHVLAVDRSPKAIAQLQRSCAELIARGRLTARCCSAEELTLDNDEAPYDLAFAFRVGAFDGRHPEVAQQALAAVRAALVPHGRLYIDRGTELVEVVEPVTTT